MAQKHFLHYRGFAAESEVLIYGNKTQVNYNSGSLNLCMISVLELQDCTVKPL